MTPVHTEYKQRKAAWGHTVLICYDRDTDGIEKFTYKCDCGHVWEQPTSKKRWHCGAINCPHLPRRVRLKLIPKPPGRPRVMSPADEALEAEGDTSSSPYRKRITFTLSYFNRDLFEDTCRIMHISMNRALQEMVEDWCEVHRNAAPKQRSKVSFRSRDTRSPQQIKDDLERDNWSDEVKAAVAATKRKTFNQLLQVDVDYTGKQSPYGN